MVSMVCYFLGFGAGFLFCTVILYFRCMHGYFYMKPVDDEKTGFYKINIRIEQEGPGCISKKFIILRKEDSPK